MSLVDVHVKRPLLRKLWSWRKVRSSIILWWC